MLCLFLFLCVLLLVVATRSVFGLESRLVEPRVSTELIGACGTVIMFVTNRSRPLFGVGRLMARVLLFEACPALGRTKNSSAESSELIGWVTLAVRTVAIATGGAMYS